MPEWAAGRLVVVATPIGNLDDLSPRAAAALVAADLVACEDTRRTAKLLRHAGSAAPMLPVHEHNEAARGEDLVRRIQAGTNVALVSDAGFPAVSDPGARIVRAAIDAGIELTVIPGPSAVAAALVASGLPTEPFAFVGFLPRRVGERVRLFERFAGWPGSVVAFESPNRLGSALAALAGFDPSRRVAVCRELTKLHEEVVRGTAAELADRYSGAVKGEVTLVIGPSSADPPERDVDAAIDVLLAAGLAPAKAAEVAAALDVAPRNVAYRAALAASRRSDVKPRREGDQGVLERGREGGGHR
jgi:16S rRNA (cytidine1402-2'-O)-methyltransferase